MKKIRSILLLSIILSIIPGFIIIKSGLSNNITDARDDDLEDIENAIIINGIEYSDNFGNNDRIDKNRGLIIFSDSFGDSISNKKAIEIPKNNSRDIVLKRDNENKEDFISRLKAQDKRWHLTPHKIKRGENLWIIARKYDTDYILIIKANNIKKPDLLNPGNEIFIPNRTGINHTIVRNETLTGISKLYSADKERIIAYNNIKKDLIITGETLFIPDAVKPADRVAESYEKGKSGYNSDLNDDESDYTLTRKKERIQFEWPLRGKISSAFGKRIDPITNKSKFHCGLDISADIGTPVKASADGKAIFSGWKKGYGRVVILKHKNGYITVYAHNKNNIIKSGETAKRGDIIAMSGISGAVTGPHLHFEIRKYLTPLNPSRFLE